jgi:hypothetical protein
LIYGKLTFDKNGWKNKKPPLNFFKDGLDGIVGMAGFEPAASTSQMWRDTGLRYIPKGNAKVEF